MKGYKAFEKGWKCRDFQYEIGKTYELPEGSKLQICECGFHFCKNPIDVFGYYLDRDDTVIAEVEALGEIQQQGTKYCTNKIKIIKEFTKEELWALVVDEYHNAAPHNTGSYNSGSYNTGSYNSGIYNSGKFNSGDYNTGNYNTGRFNAGNKNHGHSNSGIGNIGHWNSGNYNTGYCNSGDHNIGNANSGKHNTGHCNTGNYNIGLWNSGDYNKGEWNCGFFNNDHATVRFFNHQTNLTLEEFKQSLDYDWLDLCERIHCNSLNEEDIERIKALPYFDPQIFYEITGILITTSKDQEEKKNDA